MTTRPKKQFGLKLNRKSVVGRARQTLLNGVQWLNQLEKLPTQLAPMPTQLQPNQVIPSTYADTLDKNQALPELFGNPAYQPLLAHRLRALPEPFLFLGTTYETAYLQAALTNRHARCVEWDWDRGAAVSELPAQGTLLLCPTPLTETHWQIARAVREAYTGHVLTLQEVVLPITALTTALERLSYTARDLAALQSKFFERGEIDAIPPLEQVYPLANKTVIEFGPLEGYQTYALAQRCKHVTAVEARAVNYIKTLVDLDFLGVANFTLRLDDFHNVSARNYGRFDLAFAHGVYYHSAAPFVFLENLISLADTIFLGGFCPTDVLPVGEYTTLEYENRSYRAKRYLESNIPYSGINLVGHLFVGEDLMRFFSERGFAITLISDEEKDYFSGRYLRFLAQRQG